MFLHGAGTFHGFNFAVPWTEKFRVMIPFHPGFGESDDDPAMTTCTTTSCTISICSMRSGSTNSLVGFSLGGWLAANSPSSTATGWSGSCWSGRRACAARSSQRRLFELSARTDSVAAGIQLRRDQTVFSGKAQDLDFIGERYREGGTLARLLWEHPYDTKLPRYLHRVTMPTLLIWGEEDKLLPVQNAELWREYSQSGIPDLQGRRPLVLDEKREAVDAVQRFYRNRPGGWRSTCEHWAFCAKRPPRRHQAPSN